MFWQNKALLKLSLDMPELKKGFSACEHAAATTSTGQFVFKCGVGYLFEIQATWRELAYQWTVHLLIHLLGDVEAKGRGSKRRNRKASRTTRGESSKSESGSCCCGVFLCPWRREKKEEKIR